jgi:L-threonylcarbamoyladenylate synthase
MSIINVKKTSATSIQEASDILKKGGVVILPTDTNYNVVTSPFSKEGVKRIFAMKKRENLSPLTLFLGDSMELHDYAYITPQTEQLAKSLWPEKISFILYQKATLPDYVTRGFNTVAVTLHENAVLRKVANTLGTPVAGTSANLSGTGNVPDVKKAVEHIGQEVDLVIDNGLSDVEGANTIVDFTFSPPLLARKGAYPIEPLLQLVPDIKIIDEKKYKIIVKSRFLETKN